MTAISRSPSGGATAQTLGRFAGRVQDHLGLIAPLVVVAFVFLKVLRVARAQPSTTISLLSGSDKIAIAMGALLPLLYTTATAAVVAGAFMTRRSLRGKSPLGPAVGAAVFTVGLAAVMLLVPYPVLLALPILVGVVRGAWWMTDKIPVPGAAGSPTFRLLVACTAGAAAASTALWLAVDDRPWMAAEEFTIAGKVVVGYPVSEGDWTTILRDDNRTILRVRSTDITDRAICDIQAPTSLPSIAQVLAGDDHPTPYRQCSI